jgi:hypothetical protein
VAIHGLVIRQRFARAGAQGSVTFADREPRLTETPRQVLFYFWREQFPGWNYFF